MYSAYLFVYKIFELNKLRERKIGYHSSKTKAEWDFDGPSFTDLQAAVISVTLKLVCCDFFMTRGTFL